MAKPRDMDEIKGLLKGLDENKLQDLYLQLDDAAERAALIDDKDQQITDLKTARDGLQAKVDTLPAKEAQIANLATVFIAKDAEKAKLLDDHAKAIAGAAKKAQDDLTAAQTKAATDLAAKQKEKDDLDAQSKAELAAKQAEADAHAADKAAADTAKAAAEQRAAEILAKLESIEGTSEAKAKKLLDATAKLEAAKEVVAAAQADLDKLRP